MKSLPINAASTFSLLIILTIGMSAASCRMRLPKSTFASNSKSRTQKNNNSGYTIISNTEAEAVLYGMPDMAEGMYFIRTPSESEQRWNEIFKEEIKNDFLGKKFIYAGDFNSLGVGTIRRGTSTRRLLTSYYTYEEIKKYFINTSLQKTIDKEKVKKLSVNGLVDFNQANISGTAKAILKSSDSTVLRDCKFVIEEIIWDNLKDSLNEKKLRPYKKSLLEKQNRFVTAAVKVTSFEVEVFTSSTITADTKAELLDIKVPLNSANPKVKAELGFTSTGDKKIKVSTNGEFYVFVQLSKFK